MSNKCKIFRKENKQSGITLVALVVTIVVLLILAGISIRLVLDNNGIINRAGEAKDKHEQGRVNDQTDLSSVEDYLDEVMSGIKKIDGVPIPNGYYYVGGTKDTGFVISDSSEDENKYKEAEDGKVLKDNLVGNQWVWVPVDDEMLAKMCNTANTTEYKMCGTTDGNPVKAKWYSSSATLSGETITRTTPGATRGYREPDLVVGNHGESYDVKDYKTIVSDNGTLKEMAQLFKDEYETMIKSVQKYKGFYIGRYELSGSVDNPTEQSGTTITNTNWYDLYNACKKLGANADGSDKEGIATRMIWGCQWDATCDFIATKGETKSITDSKTWGNYDNSDGDAAVKETKEDGTEEDKYGSKQITGYSEYWKANNIYDIAGNCNEWTQEANESNLRAYRGGCYSVSGFSYPASCRHGAGYPTSNSDRARYSSHFNNYNWHLECENQWKKI